MKKYLFPFACVCFITSVLVHIISAFGMDLGQYFPFIDFIPFGLIFVWAPVVKYTRQHEKEDSETSFWEDLNSLKFFKKMYQIG